MVVLYFVYSHLFTGLFVYSSVNIYFFLHLFSSVQTSKIMTKTRFSFKIRGSGLYAFIKYQLTI